MEAIDLGLSVKWSNCNLGASCPEELGNHYAWGEVIPKNIYTWETYKWCNGTYDSITKYCTNRYGTVDNKTVLDPEDDAARANWDGAWRMPTLDECEELINNCILTWIDNYNGTNIAGQLVTASNGESIFLPATGYYDNYGDFNDNRCIYWSSSLYTVYPYDAYSMCFYSDDTCGHVYNNHRCIGLPIRPVFLT